MRTATGLVLLLLLSAPVRAEVTGRIDAFLGVATGGETELTLEERDLFGGRTVEHARFATGASTAGGLRALGGPDAQPWVVAIDLRFFRTDNCCLDTGVLDLGLGGGFRPHEPLLHIAGGGVRPYALAGMDFAMIDGDARTATLRTDIGVPSGAESHLGYHVAAGLEWQVSSRHALTLEFRHLAVSMDTMTTNNLFVPTSNIEASGEMTVDGILVGYAWYPTPKTPAAP